MRKRVLICLTLFIAVALAVVLGYWFMKPRPRIDEATCEKIRRGMTESEVEAIIGAPPGDYGVGESTVFALLEMPNAKRWFGQDCGIFVTFDDRGKVAHTSVIQVFREYDSTFHKVCCMLRLQEKNPR